MHDASFFWKVIGPTLPSILLHRKALVTHLQEAIAPELHKDDISARYKLVLCCAPAGYGKTTLLADFARSTSLPCCWYFLERADTDPIVFLRMLLASIRHTFPQFGASLDPQFHILSSEDISSTSSIYYSTLDALCTAFATEIPERFAIILSNYEEINENETLTDLVNFLLRKLPSQATLIIESRVITTVALLT